MYGHPELGLMPDYKPDLQDADAQCTRACQHPMNCNGSCMGNFAPVVSAILSTYHCEGCEE